VARDNTARYLERLSDLNDSIKRLTLKELLSKQLDGHVFKTRSGCTPTTDAFRQYLEHAAIERAIEDIDTPELTSEEVTAPSASLRAIWKRKKQFNFL